MEAVEAYKYLGLVYFAVIWAAMLYSLGRKPHDKTKSVSRHVATYRETFIMFAVVRTVALPLWILFAFGWLVPVLDLPLIASVLFAAGVGAEMISAWVPAVEGRKGKIHSLSALLVAAMYIPLSFLFALSPDVSGLARTIIWADILAMIILGVLFMVREKTKEYYLYFQLAYFILFDTAFLSAAFL
jgi:hypothetical protein